MLDERSVQTVSTPFNVFKNKENVESVLKESLHNLNLTQHTFNKLSTFSYAFNNVERPIQTPPTFGSTTVSVERMLKQMFKILKPFKRAFITKQLVRTG